MNCAALPQNGFLRLPQIIGDKKRNVPGLIPVSRSKWYEGIKKGIFPPPDKRFGERTSVWHVDVIRNLIDLEKTQ